jgi:hypothetical protein
MRMKLRMTVIATTRTGVKLRRATLVGMSSRPRDNGGLEKERTMGKVRGRKQDGDEVRRGARSKERSETKRGAIKDMATPRRHQFRGGGRGERFNRM